MKKTIVVCALMVGTLALIFIPLYAIKDSHYGVSNVCLETLYPDVCK